jgi:AraC family transcriptional regulator of adaptative response/methylated-DNA-[protein]-cysteine methyltransferase
MGATEKTEGRDLPALRAAVLRRDPAADGRFVFAVTSTGVYCRPSCPARRPRPDRIRFFADGAQARDAGYRPCRRCDPDGEVRPSDRLAQICCRYIEAHLDDRLTLPALGKALGASPHHLQRRFRQAIGVTPRQYAQHLRMERARQALRRSDSVTAALYAAGFSSPAPFYREAKRRLGAAPAAYRRGGPTEIWFSSVGTAVGVLAVAASDRGICAIQLHDDDGAAERSLRAEFPNARLRRDDTRLRPWVAAVVGHLERGTPLPTLPTDIRATAFQAAVWQALRTIPRGETRTYAEVAERCGRPGAARAVGRACAANPLAILTPCHRVVHGGTGRSAYRWGADRKASLLALERKSAETLSPATP